MDTLACLHRAFPGTRAGESGGSGTANASLRVESVCMVVPQLSSRNSLLPVIAAPASFAADLPHWIACSLRCITRVRQQPTLIGRAVVRGCKLLMNWPFDEQSVNMRPGRIYKDMGFAQTPVLCYTAAGSVLSAYKCRVAIIVPLSDWEAAHAV